jgi:hypothetical protein
MGTVYCIDRVDDTSNVEETKMVAINNSVDSYVLADLPDGLVIKDVTDGTTGWKIKVSNTGVLSTESVTVV